MKIHTISALAEQLKNKDISSVEITERYLHKIKNSSNNAFISVLEQKALSQAQVADKKRAKGESNVLLGIPMAQKDIFCVENTKTTCGSKILENFIAPYTATVIDNLQSQGIVSIGKASMDEFAMGSSNENPYFGSVTNPWSKDTPLVPGGSSGGSAAAVAEQLIPCATGSDTGGSIRQPAAFCGLTGIKPTYGRCSRYGMIAFASSLDCAGTLTHTAEDAALLLNAMCGHDKKDSTSLNIATQNYSQNITQSINGLKIGVPKSFFNANLDNDVAHHIQLALQEYEKQGATIVDIELPHNELALASYYVIAPCEASSNLSRFDGVRYGHRAEEYHDLASLYTNTRSEGFSDEVKRRIIIGTFALSSGYYEAYYAKAQKIRRLISQDFDTAFTQCDVIMGPTTPSTAFAQGSTKDPVTMYLNDIYTIPASLAGLPAASIQAGISQDGLPIGLHIIAPHLQESRLLNIAHRFQMATDWHTKTASINK